MKQILIPFIAKRTLILSLLFFPLLCYAQRVAYTYDGAGNRIIRALDGIKYTIEQEDEDQNESKLSLTDDVISVYPNPTDGPLVIDIAGFDNSNKGEVKVFSISGQLIIQEKIVESRTRLELSGYTNGMYLVNITVNDRDSIWKIIKR